MTKPNNWLAVILVLIGLPVGLLNATQAQSQLVVGTWGGHYEVGQQKVFFKPFEGLAKIEVDPVPHGGNLHKLIAKHVSGHQKWDVLDLDQVSLENACRSGFVTSIDQEILPPGIGGLKPEEDFLTGGIHECGIANSAWSKIFAVKLSAFEESPPPQSIAELFDLENHPGGRGFFKSPEGLLELALLSEGVPQAEIYSTLASETGLQRALDKLTTIRKQIFWLKSSQQGLDLLEEGKIKIAQGFHNDLLAMASNQENGIALLWDHQLLALSYWAVVASSAVKDKALEFVSFATSPGATASQASFLGYGPSRRSAQSLVREDLRAYMPTHPDHLQSSFMIDFYWWDNEGRKAKSAFWNWHRSGVK